MGNTLDTRPALAALVWSIASLHRPGYSCHAISKSRSPASSARPVLLRSPKHKHLHVTRCTVLSRLLHLRFRRFPPVNVLARTSHAVFLLVNGYARSSAWTVPISYRWLQLDISLALEYTPRVLRRLSLWSLKLPRIHCYAHSTMRSYCSSAEPPISRLCSCGGSALA